jgi:hypothetical protein
LLFTQATQTPTHWDSQQTPSTQELLAHSFAPPQAAPFALSGTHVFDEQ